MINRNDMLELTRRMTVSRNCFSRIAGAYMDAEGYEDGSFNIHFGKLTAAETARNLELAKSVIFSETNEQLKEYVFPVGPIRRRGMWNMLMALKENRLKDDALLSVFYEVAGESCKLSGPFSIFMFSGSYDVPVKGADREWLEGSEIVYDFLICAVSPLKAPYEPGKPEFGFLFPAFKDRYSDEERINIFNADPKRVQTELMSRILGT